MDMTYLLPRHAPQPLSREVEVDAQSLIAIEHRAIGRSRKQCDLRDLVAVSIDGLDEIAVVAQQADGDERNAQIAGSLWRSPARYRGRRVDREAREDRIRRRNRQPVCGSR
jgi:hypothetical protein